MTRWLLALVLAGCGGTASELDAGPRAPDGGGSGTDGGGGGGAGLTAWEQEVLDAHNRVRTNAMPPPTPALPAMRWSPSAATLAKDWAVRCDFNHRDPNALGENLFASTNERTATTVVDDWASESASYSYASNSCALLRVCGHYTQLVWRSSVGLGCAQQRCTTGSPFGSGTWFLVVCNYDPPGNFAGQRPY